MRKRILQLEREHCTPKLKVAFHIIDETKQKVPNVLNELNKLESEHHVQVIFIT